VACLFEATVCMADLESTTRTAFLKAVGLSSSCYCAVANAVISSSKLVLLHKFLFDCGNSVSCMCTERNNCVNYY
jgi:hypothetical protein